MLGFQHRNHGVCHLLGRRRGNAVVLVTIFVAMMMGLSIVFFKKSSGRMDQTSNYLDNKDAQYDVEAAHSLAVAKLERALGDVDLLGRLRYVGGPTLETFNNLSNAYATDTTTAMEFLRDAFESQSYSAAGVQSSTHEFRSFATAFPST